VDQRSVRRHAPAELALECRDDPIDVLLFGSSPEEDAVQRRTEEPDDVRRSPEVLSDGMRDVGLERRDPVHGGDDSTPVTSDGTPRVPSRREVDATPATRRRSAATTSLTAWRR